MRILAILVLLWVVCHWHAVAEVNAKAVDGVALANMAGGHVSVTGVVTDAKAKRDGSLVITLESAQRTVVCWASPLLAMALPPTGVSVLVVGKVIGAGMVAIDPAGLTITKSLVVARNAGIPVLQVWVGGTTANGLRRHVSYETFDRDIHADGLVSRELAAHLVGSHVLYGHREDKFYLIETRE